MLTALIIYSAIASIAICVLIYLLNNSLDMSSNTESNIEILLPHLKELKVAAEHVLAKEIYSNDPVIIHFIVSLKNISDILKTIDVVYSVEE